MGKDLVNAFRSYMKEDFDRLVVAKSYETTDPTVDSQIVSLKSSGAEALFIGGTPKFAAQALRKVGEVGWKPLTIINYPSSSIAGTLLPAGPANSKGVISGTFQKDPTDARWANDPASHEYRTFLSKYLPAGDVAESAYVLGAIQGQILEQILKQCGSDLSRENIIKQALSLKDFSPGMAPYRVSRSILVRPIIKRGPRFSSSVSMVRTGRRSESLSARRTDDAR